jgi:uncharacterized protein
MLKLLLVVVVLVVAAWLWIGRRRPPGAPPAAKPPARPEAPKATQTMLACAHCGVHLPQGDALMDAAGRPYCNEAHRLQGPR